MAGSYLIDSSGGGDYRSLSQAVVELQKEGISNTVRLQLKAGTYAGGVEISNIPGHTAEHKIVIESFSGNPQEVVIEHAGTPAAPFALQLKDSPGVTIRNITINTAASEEESGTAVSLAGIVENLLLENVSFLGEGESVAIHYGFAVEANNYTYGEVRNLQVLGCRFRHFRSSLGSAASLVPPAGAYRNITFAQNSCTDAGGASFTGVSELAVQDNTFKGQEDEISPLALFDCSAPAIVEKNIIINATSAIYVYSSEGNAAGDIMIRNNFLSGEGTLLTIHSANRVSFLNNSLHGKRGSYQLVSLSMVDSVKLYNNIFYQNAASHVLELHEVENFSSDYNSYFSAGGELALVADSGTELETLEELQQQLGTDGHSLELDPLFESDTSYSPTAIALIGAGKPLVEVIEDIEGEPRDPHQPDIGADEVNELTNLALQAVTVPAEVAPDTEVNIQWKLQNAGEKSLAGPWVDEVYLSDDQQLDEADILLGSKKFSGTLAAGESSMESIPLLLSPPSVGTFHIIIKLDAEEVLQEDRSDNILSSAPVVILPQNRPDLSLSHIQVPAQLNSGSVLTVHWTVTNTGEQPTTEQWADYLYFSHDSAYLHNNSYFKVDSAVLAKVESPLGLAPGESYTQSYQFKLPLRGSGKYFLKVVADGGQRQNEIDGTVRDNAANSKAISITQSSLADLIVTAINFPETAFSGEKIDFSYTIKNEGTAPTAYDSWEDLVYLSTDPDPSVETAMVESWRSRNQHENWKELQPDETQVVQGSFTLPFCVADTFYVFMQLDVDEKVVEISEENNAAVGSHQLVAVLKPGADLVVENLQLSEQEFYTESTILLKYQIANRGLDTIRVLNNLQESVYLSEDPSLNPAEDQQLSTSFYLDSMTFKVNDLRARELRVQLPDSLFGDYYLIVQADYPNNFCETPYENNNTLASRQINIQLAPTKDLLPEQLALETSGVAGEQLSLSYQLKNKGEGAVENKEVVDSLFLVPVGASVAEAYYWYHSKRRFSLGSEEVRPEEVQLHIPVLLAPGKYRLGIKTDATGKVYEYEAESNNLLYSESFDITRDEGKLANLELQPLELPATIYSGQTLEIHYLVKNLSPAGTNIRSWRDEIQLLQGDKILLEEEAYHYTYLEGEGAYEGTLRLKLPDDLSGEYTLQLKVDSKKHVQEYFRENNSQAITVNVQLSPWADLLAEALSIEGELVAGQPVRMSWALVNQGEEPTNTLFTNKLYVSKDRQLDQRDQEIAKLSVKDTIVSGASLEQSLSFRIPPELEGQYYLLLKADASEQVFEHHDEENNLFISEDPVFIRRPEPVDLEPLTAKIKLSEADHTISYEVINQGPQAAYGSWTDAVFLSEDRVWDQEDVLLGYQNYQAPEEGLTAGTRYEGWVNFSGVFVKPAEYFVLVKSDVFHYIPDLKPTNNTKASENAYYMDLIAELIPGQPRDSVFWENEQRSHYYKLKAEREKSLLLTLEGQQQSGSTELYYSVHKLPERGGDFDYKGENAFQPVQQIIVPSKDSSTTDYVLSHGDFLPGGSLGYTISAEEKSFSILNVTPDHGGNPGIMVMDINGFDFSDSLQAVLRSPKGVEVEAVHTFANSSIKGRAHFNLNNVPPGTYDVVLQRLDRQDEAILSQAFEVEDSAEVGYYVEVTGPERVRFESEFTMQVNFKNTGNINDYDIFLLVGISLKNHEVEGNLSVSYLGDGRSDQLPGELQKLHPFSNESLIQDEDGYYLYTWLPVFAAQSSGQLTFKLNNKVQDTIVVAAHFLANPISDIHFSGNLDDLKRTRFIQQLDSIFSVGMPVENQSNARFMRGECISDPAAVEAMIWKGVRAHAEYISGGIPSNGGQVVELLLQEGFKSMINPDNHLHAEGVVKDLTDGAKPIVLDPTQKSSYDHLLKNLDACLEQHPDIVKDIESKCLKKYRKVVNGRYQTVYNNICNKIPTPGSSGGDFAVVPVVKSIDPNDILGPAGTGAPRFVYTEEVLPYTIRFENIATATAPAQRVAIENELPEAFDLRRFRLKEVGWGDTTIQLPEVAYYSGTFDLGAKYHHHQLQLVAGIDAVNRRAFWRFQTIDPATGAPPAAADAGFLPPNNENGIGEGFVSYSIEAQDTLSAGTELKNQAVIVFDQEKRLATNTWVNTIAGELPESFVLALEPEIDSTSFTVSWQEAGNPFLPEIEGYTLFVSKNNEPYKVWLQHTSGTEAVFTGAPGNTYSFFSQATTTDGRVESAPAEPDAVTTLPAEEGAPTAVLEEDLFSLLNEQPFLIYPNPASNLFNIAYRLKQSGNVLVEIIDMAGRLRKTISLGRQAAGDHLHPVSLPKGIDSGVYMIRLKADKQIMNQRLLKN